MAKDWKALIAQAEQAEKDAKAKLEATHNDPAIAAKWAELKAKRDETNKLSEEASDKLSARQTAVLVEKEIIVSTKGNDGSTGYRTNPKLIEAVLAQAGLKDSDVKALESPHTKGVFKVRSYSSYGAIDRIIERLKEMAVAADPEMKRLRAERDAAYHEASRAQNDHWRFEHDTFGTLENEVDARHRDLIQVRSDAEVAIYRAEAQKTRKVRSPEEIQKEKDEVARLDRGKLILNEIYAGKRPFNWPPGSVPTPDEKLLALRAQWEKGYTVERETKTEDGALMVMLTKDNGHWGAGNNYRLHRYFQLGEDWQVSVDYEGGDEPRAQ